MSEHKLQADVADRRKNAVKSSSPISADASSLGSNFVFSIFDSPVTYATWLERCHQVKALVGSKMSDSYSFREATRVMREQAWNDIGAQQDATDYTLRKRIYQTQKARNELDWQRLKVLLVRSIGYISTFISIKSLK